MVAVVRFDLRDRRCLRVPVAEPAPALLTRFSRQQRLHLCDETLVVIAPSISPT